MKLEGRNVKEDSISNDKGNSRISLNLRSARDLMVVCLIVVATWKLITSDITISIQRLDLNDVIAILIAFFAIGLSVAFYFKATETSNRFYDNSYVFTKDMSELLGRIEAGFGEKLKHLGDGNDQIMRQFDRFDPTKTNEDIEKEEEEIAKKQKEQIDELDKVATKANLGEKEKKDFLTDFANSSIELVEAKNELGRLREQVRKYEASTGYIRPGELLDTIAKLIVWDNSKKLSKSIKGTGVNELFPTIESLNTPLMLADLYAANLLNERRTRLRIRYAIQVARRVRDMLDKN